MSQKAMLLSGLVTAGLVLLTAWVFELRPERAVVLAPLVVVAAGAAAGLVVLWARVGWESLRRRPDRWRLLALGLVVLAVLIGLSLLGLKLPRE